MPNSSRVARFGAFEANLATGELRKQGLKIRISQQVFQVLAMLLENPGEVVDRRELQRRLWPGQSFFDFEHGLNKAVNRLRQALNDSASTPRFIETLPRRGYRLIAPVSAAEFSFPAALRAPTRMRLAVLPFENLSSEPEHEFFSDGLTEEMISQLGRLNPSQFGVIARTSSMQYKRTKKRIDEIARELSVEYILEGSVRKTENRVRITAQLIHARDQTHLWVESYNRELADIFQVQNEVAQRVASTLAVELRGEDSGCIRPVPPEAYEAYLRGRFFWNKGTAYDAKTAIQWFENAVRQYPQYGLAYSGIADCYARLAWYGALPSREASPLAKFAASRALEIDDRLGEAHASMALAYFWYEWNWSEAEHEFRRAIELKPNYAAAHNWHAAYLNTMQRFEEAAAEQKIAEELDPLSLTIAMNAADPHYFARRYDTAIEYLERVVKREPNFFPAHYNLGRACAVAGRHRQAINAFETAARLSGVPGANTAVAYAYARAGDTDRARAIEREVKKLATACYIPSPQLALSSLGLGETDRALDQLEAGFEERSYLMIYLKADPIYDVLRSNSRFKELLRRMNFGARWS
ncbi:MAG: winged helix-turn-helix domain-containing protein [Terriglobia bacterium]